MQRIDTHTLLVAATDLRDTLRDLPPSIVLPGAEEARVGAGSAVRQLDDYVLPRLRDVDAPVLAVVGAVQWLLAAALAAGLLWLLAIFVVAWFNLPDLPSADVGRLPAPTVLAVGGAVAGLLVAALARWATAVGARRRASVARRRLVAAATDVGRELVTAPLEIELATMARLHGLVARLRRG